MNYSEDELLSAFKNDGPAAEDNARIWEGLKKKIAASPHSTVGKALSASRIKLLIGLVALSPLLYRAFTPKTPPAPPPEATVLPAAPAKPPPPPPVPPALPGPPKMAAVKVPRQKKAVKPALAIEVVASEWELLSEAREALGAQSFETCLTLLSRHETAFPQSRLSLERESLRILALCELGKSELALSALQARPAEDFKNSPYFGRLQSSCVYTGLK